MAEKTTKTTKEKPAKAEAKPKAEKDEKPKKETKSKPKKIIAKLNPFQQNIKDMKMFGRWTTHDVIVSDPGL